MNDTGISFPSTSETAHPQRPANTYSAADAGGRVERADVLPNTAFAKPMLQTLPPFEGGVLGNHLYQHYPLSSSLIKKLLFCLSFVRKICDDKYFHVLTSLSITTRIMKIRKLNAGRLKLLKLTATESSSSDFISLLLPPLFPAHIWERSSVSYQASTESERNLQGRSICSFPCIACSLPSVQITGNFFFFFATPVCTVYIF